MNVKLGSTASDPIGIRFPLILPLPDCCLTKTLLPEFSMNFSVSLCAALLTHLTLITIIFSNLLLLPPFYTHSTSMPRPQCNNSLDNKFQKIFCICDEYVVNVFVGIY